jgi:hypothetical protein
MDFVNGLYLWGILAAALPILIHLYFKRRKVRVQFSTLLFFVKKERLFAFRRKLYELLLLLLRVLIVILLALALSRIFFKRFNFISGGGTGAVIILDDSLTMQRKTISGDTAFNYGIKQAEKILNSLSGDDSAALVYTSGITGINLTKDKNAILKALRRAKPCAVPASLGGAMEKAGELLKSSPGVNREIYIISDFAQSNKPLKPFNIRKFKNTRVYCLPVRGSNENISVNTEKLDSAPKIIKRGVKIPFKLQNHGSLTRRITAELKVYGKAIQRKTFSLKPGASLQEEFIYVPERAGQISLCVDIDDENIPLDNRAWYSFAVSENINVLLLRGEGQSLNDPFYFFRLALEPSEVNAVNGIRCSTLDIPLLNRACFENKHVVCIASSKSLDKKGAELLRVYMRSGGVVMSSPASPKESCLLRLLPEAPAGKVIKQRSQGFKFNAPLRELNDLLELKLVRWRKIINFESGIDNILGLAGSSVPAIIEQRMGKGKLITLAFSLRRDFSNWPALKSYPVAMVALVNYAAGNQDNTFISYCGSTLELPGSKIAYSSTSGQGGIFSKDAQDYSRLPAVLTFEGAKLQAAVFNPAPAESRTTSANDSELRKWFNAPLTILNINNDIISQITQFRKGSELTGWFLLLMLILLGVEFLLGAKLTLLKQGGKK